MSPGATQSGPPPIPDHGLIRRIAVGSYGSIWLARNVFGAFRAVKLVRRRTFKSARQYEREFEGVRQFEPISRSHPGFVQILHVGRNDAEGHFYYVMELADDLQHRRQIQPASYQPRTLRAELDRRRRLPLDECLLLGQTLLLALEELHARGLVHRDLKPANLIYVDGVPKLADIGTVATAGHKDTPVGSIGYNPPEGSGRPAADVFSFGRVLYEMFSGVHVQELADALPDLRPRLKDERQRKFYDILQAATQANPSRRLPSARSLREALSALLPVHDVNAGRKDAPRPAVTDPIAPTVVEESPYGAVPPDSPSYVRREADATLEAAWAR
ncbi:MAG TPA: protein kinase, partial [Verrucomicrobiae bacterium]